MAVCGRGVCLTQWAPEPQRRRKRPQHRRAGSGTVVLVFVVLVVIVVRIRLAVLAVLAVLAAWLKWKCRARLGARGAGFSEVGEKEGHATRAGLICGPMQGEPPSIICKGGEGRGKGAKKERKTEG